jgi:serine/threonine protein kinase
LPEEEAKSIIKQSLQAIKHLHGLEIAHRDLKPENILFVEQGEIIKLIDFGMSKICKD